MLRFHQNILYIYTKYLFNSQFYSLFLSCIVLDIEYNTKQFKQQKFVWIKFRFCLFIVYIFIWHWFWCQIPTQVANIKDWTKLKEVYTIDTSTCQLWKQHNIGWWPFIHLSWRSKTSTIIGQLINYVISHLINYFIFNSINKIFIHPFAFIHLLQPLILYGLLV